MKKINQTVKDNSATKRGYNEKNPGQSQGAFPPASAKHQADKNEIKSNAADKKAKEDQN
jgi:hypothetical protein